LNWVATASAPAGNRSGPDEIIIDTSVDHVRGHTSAGFLD
jgi:hypothetical protein